MKFTLKNLHVSIPDHCKGNFNCQLEIEEFDAVINKLAKNKSPGPDGITAEFYQKYWRLLRVPLHEAFMASFKQNKLYESARMGILNLLPKANKDTRRTANLRPITLLNVDYKILEKVLAERILDCLKEIVSSDQRGFLPDRRISVNIRKMLDIIEKMKDAEEPGVIISCDFQKAFDKVNLQSLLDAMKCFNFSPVPNKMD